MADSLPTVSVCVPTFNYGRFLPDCIESVQAQTFEDWELVVVNDCSTDDTDDVVRRYAASDRRIRYHVNERRLGMSANLKHAADLGTGQFLKILCADDWLAPRCLEILFDLMNVHRHVVLATGAEINCDETGNSQRLQFLFGKPISVISGDDMLDRMGRGEGFGGNSSFFIRTNAYRLVGGFNGNLPYAPDYDLAARLCFIGDYLHVDEPVFFGRVHPAASSQTNPAKLLDVIDAFDVPDQVLRPRPFCSRNWWRYQRVTMYRTAQFILNVCLNSFRGNPQYAFALAKIVICKGNVLGIPYLAVHGPARLAYRLKRAFGVRKESGSICRTSS